MKTSHLVRPAVALALLAPLPLLAQALPALTSTPAGAGGTQYSLSVQTLLLLTSLSFLPAIVLMMTSFTRIVIVMSLLRHALGTQTSPPNQVMVGLSLFLTFFIMSPVADKVYTDAWQPPKKPDYLLRPPLPLPIFVSPMKNCLISTATGRCCRRCAAAPIPRRCSPA